MSEFRVRPIDLVRLQSRTDNIRNFCILAHVDHGKTTLSDSLISSNGVISQKSAGKVRFLDSTEEEQKRGITMHSSAISLLFRGGEQKDDEYLINLVDSPGHIDFSSDVSAATRLCDGALIVIDVLEGVCTQTHAVLFKALKERIRPCLVLNKIDRLAVELMLTPVEAFHHLRRIIENVNALAFSLVTSEFRLMQENSPSQVETITQSQLVAPEIDENDPFLKEWAFSPEKGNVVFASALDCWGFGVGKFATLWAKKLGLNRNVLQKYLFEDYSLNMETKKIVKWDSSNYSSQPMFADLVLAPLWKLYELAVTQHAPDKAAEFAKSDLNVQLTPREINPRDPRSTLQCILRRWLPLPDAILRMVVRCMPSPKAAQTLRAQTLLAHLPPVDLNPSHLLSSCVESRITNIELAVSNCTFEPELSSDVVVFIAKMTPVRVAELKARDVSLLASRLEQKRQSSINSQQSNEGLEIPIDAQPPLPPISLPEETFMALGRVFSGVLRPSSRLFVIGHRHDPRSFTQHIHESSHLPEDIETLLRMNPSSFCADLLSDASSDLHNSFSCREVPPDSIGLYLCLGPSVAPMEFDLTGEHPIDGVPAGNIVGIVGLEDYVLKTGTVSSTWACPPLKAITFQAKPMLKVAVEPLSHNMLPDLERGLQSLHQFDPVVEIGVDNNGQHTMTCLGELHLDLCVKTLREKFAKCEITVSEPLVPFRETVIASSSSMPIASGSGSGSGSAEMISSTDSPVHFLPPPWRDTPGLQHAQSGQYTCYVPSSKLSLSWRCFPLPLSLATILENNPQESQSLFELVSRHHEYLGSMQKKQGEEEQDQRTLSSSDDTAIFLQRFTPNYEKLSSLLTNGFTSSSQSEEETSIDSCLLPAIPSPSSEGSSHSSLLTRLLSVGPKPNFTNFLLFSPNFEMDIYQSYSRVQLKPEEDELSSLAQNSSSQGIGTIAGILLRTLKFTSSSDRSLIRRVWSRLHSSVVAGFQSASEKGPLMNEPMFGVGFSLEKLEIDYSVISSCFTESELSELLSTTTSTESSSPSGGISSVSSISLGQLISETKDSLHLSMLSCGLRVVEPIYACELQCDSAQLGNLYSVLSKRRGFVVQEDVIDGTSLFLLSARLPIADSFGFAQELLKKTSGNGTAPQLSFSHWSIRDQDPFWKPLTEEELEEFGEQGVLEENKTRVLIDRVRKRKGLPIEEKVVASAEKQRNMNKKK